MSDVTAPLPKMPVWQYDGDIIITGASAKMPESENIAEFKENLYSHVDMITDAETRWPAGLYGLPKRLGKLKDLSKFDAAFFGVNPKQAHVTIIWYDINTHNF